MENREMVEYMFKLPMEQHLPAGMIIHKKGERAKLKLNENIVVFSELMHREEVTCNRWYMKNIFKMKETRGSWDNNGAKMSNVQTYTILITT